jgi:hypothetical protein
MEVVQNRAQWLALLIEALNVWILLQESSLGEENVGLYYLNACVSVVVGHGSGLVLYCLFKITSEKFMAILFLHI